MAPLCQAGSRCDRSCSEEQWGPSRLQVWVLPFSSLSANLDLGGDFQELRPISAHGADRVFKSFLTVVSLANRNM